MFHNFWRISNETSAKWNCLIGLMDIYIGHLKRKIIVISVRNTIVIRLMVVHHMSENRMSLNVHAYIIHTSYVIRHTRSLNSENSNSNSKIVYILTMARDTFILLWTIWKYSWPAYKRCRAYRRARLHL